jgi:hypothetical protein
VQRRKSLQIAVAAVGVAIAGPCIILTNLLPLSVTLLTVAAVCYYIVFDKAGILFGFLAMAAASGISFLGGVGSAQILNLVLFVPYSVLAYFMRKAKFGNVKHMLIRALAVAAFANIAFIALFFLAGVIIQLPVGEFVGTAGYALVTVLFTFLMIAVDIMFSQFCKFICGKIKIGGR